MSSHHFVKDGQEPPLIILDWNTILEAHAKQLMAWQPKVIVHEQILDQFLISGFKPDGIIGAKSKSNFDYLEPLEWFEKQEIYSKFDSVTLLINKELQDLIEIATNYNTTIYTDHFKIYRYKKALFEKWLPSGKTAFYYEYGIKQIRNKNGKCSHFFTKPENIIIESV